MKFKENPNTDESIPFGETRGMQEYLRATKFGWKKPSINIHR